MSGLWRELPAEVRSMANYREERTRTYRGLQLWEVFDQFTGSMAPDYWIVALENSGETLMTLLCGETRAIEIATEFAHYRDWTKTADWDGLNWMQEQINLVARFPGEASPPASGDDRWDFEDDSFIPYGPD